MSGQDKHIFVPIGGRLRHLLLARGKGFSIVMRQDTDEGIDEAEWTEAMCTLAHTVALEAGETLLAGWGGKVYAYVALEYDGDLDPVEHTLIRFAWAGGDEQETRRRTAVRGRCRR